MIAHQHVLIDGNRIADWDSFHDLFAQAFGFPAFYGRSLDAWIDCLSSLDAPEAGLASLQVAPGGVVVLCLAGVAELRRRCPEIYDAIVEGAAFVNHRRIERGARAILVLAFDT